MPVQPAVKIYHIRKAKLLKGAHALIFVLKKITAHVDAEIKPCGVCQRKTKGIFPADMQGALQYGNGLKAYAINLIVCQMVALNRVQKCHKAMIGQTVSEASLLKFVWRLHQALEA